MIFYAQTSDKLVIAEYVTCTNKVQLQIRKGKSIKVVAISFPDGEKVRFADTQLSELETKAMMIYYPAYFSLPFGNDRNIHDLPKSEPIKFV